MLKQILERIRQKGFWNAFGYTVVRFSTVRFLAYWWNRFFGQHQSYDLTKTLFPNHDLQKALTNIRIQAFYESFSLSPKITQAILQYAHSTPCFSFVDGAKVFYSYAEREATEQKLQKKLILGYYDEPSKHNVELNKIEMDPWVLSLTSAYLGSHPKKIDTRLWWSFACEVPEQERLRASQTVWFHYDLEGYHFIYFNFYISDVDALSGAHVAVRGSHHKKPLRFLLGSAARPDADILAYYGSENVVTFTGPAGTGFIEDAFCFHKALPPQNKDRLLLQIRMTT